MRIDFITWFTSIALAGMLTGCMSSFDMQGTDPAEYYAEHPIENRIEKRSTAVSVHFEGNEPRLSGNEIDKVRSSLRHISPLAAETATLQLSDADMHNQARKEHLKKLLYSMGYAREKVKLTSSPELERGEVDIKFIYVAVIFPDCPDWRTSPVTTYSNVKQANFKCAHEVNLGMMVADPHDLITGPGLTNMDTARASRAIQNSRSSGGKDTEAAPAAPSTTEQSPMSNPTQGGGGALGTQTSQ